MSANSITPDARRAWLKRSALRHLARREHARRELETKLLEGLRRWRRSVDEVHHIGSTGKLSPAVDAKEVDSDAADRAAVAAVLDELDRRGLQSDTRTADLLVHARSERFGARRLRADLQRRGVPREAAERALAPLAGTELNRAAALWQRRFGERPATPTERARQMRWLAGRGFSAEVARRVVGGSVGDNDSEA